MSSVAPTTDAGKAIARAFADLLSYPYESPRAVADTCLGVVAAAHDEARALIDREVPVALATDVNPGGGATIFLTSLLDHPDFGPEHLAVMPHFGLGGAPVPHAVADRAEAGERVRRIISARVSSRSERQAYDQAVQGRS